MSYMTFSLLMQRHHKHCDEAFAAAEAAASKCDWTQAQEQCAFFVRALEDHFRAEEELLFPAFENATGMIAGPTQVMRMEHRQMRELVAAMRAALERKDEADFLGAAQTLLIMMQQHNLKEENILYPMLDRALAAQEASLAAQVNERLAASFCAV
ncbi:MAG: hemerythrin domain-containing protein [Rhodocyclaceae bacterium]|nr:hemerythrin domain-containing protein [Rhodocyclaceae bacterium]